MLKQVLRRYCSGLMSASALSFNAVMKLHGNTSLKHLHKVLNHPAV